MDQEELMRICLEARLPARADLVLREPYLPYVPPEWNRVLVLAEAQNLSLDNQRYVDALLNMSERERTLRLECGRGVKPWDDGSLPLAVAAALDCVPASTAFGNAVVWSERASNGNNANPSLKLQDASARLWGRLLPVLRAERIVTAGKIAANVIVRALAISGLSRLHLKLRLPAPTALSRVSGMFREEDLLRRYPEVDAAIRRYPEAAAAPYRQNKVFFACHAVSSLR